MCVCVLAPGITDYRKLITLGRVVPVGASLIHYYFSSLSSTI